MTEVNYYEQNIQVMKRCKEYLYIQLQLIPKEYYIDLVDSVYSIETREEDNALCVVTKDGENHRLNSPFHPDQEARRWVEQFKFHSVGKRFLLFGLGNGIFAKEILKNLREDEILLIYEPCGDIFLHILNNYDLTELLEDQRVSITVKGINNDEFNQSVPFYIRYINLVSQVVGIHPKYDQMFPYDCKWFYTFIMDNRLKAVVNKNTFKALGRIRTTNLLKNMRYVGDANCMNDYKSKFPEDIPAIIVSAGPSLNKNIEVLKKAKGKAVIIAVDSSLRMLYKHNVVPDFVVTIDANKSPVHFETYKEAYECAYFCSIGAKNSIVSSIKGRRIIYDSDDYMEAINLSNNEGISVPTAGSVSTDAFSICSILGFKIIILVGQDLAYDGIYTHADNRVANDDIGTDDLQEVEDIYGNKIKTRSDWYIFLQWYKDAVYKYQGEVIDATEGGAKIDGTKILKLEEAIEEYCTKEFDCKTLIDKLKPTSNELYMKKLCTEYREALCELDVLKEKAERAIGLCSNLITENETYSTESYRSKQMIKELLKLNKEINELKVNILINNYIAENIADGMMDMFYLSGNKKDDKLLVYKKSLIIYEKIPSATVEVKEIIKPILTELEEQLEMEDVTSEREV